MKMSDSISYIAGFIRKYGTRGKSDVYVLDMGGIPYTKCGKTIRIDRFMVSGETVYIKYGKGVNGNSRTIRLSMFDKPKEIAKMESLFRFYNKRE